MRWDRGCWPAAALTAALLLACTPAPPVPAPVAPAAVGGQSAPAAPQETPSLQTLVEAARKEGQLTLVWSAGILGGSQGAARLIAGFNRYHGLNVSVQYTPGPSPSDLVARLVQEQQTGRPATTDVFWGGADSVYALSRAQVLEPADWAVWAPNVRDSRLLSPRGDAVEIASFLPGITYNASKLAGDAVPRSMDDLLKPQYKGRVASTPYVIHFDSLASPELWGEERVLVYAAKLSDQLAGLMRCGEHERVASGEFDLFALDCGSFGARRLAAEGAPLDHSIPRDAALLQTNSMGVPRHAAHPAAAKLFVDYMLTREAQDYVYEWYFSDHPLLPGSKAAAEIEKARADRAQFTSLDVAFFERNEGRHLDQVAAEVQRLFQQR